MHGHDTHVSRGGIRDTLQFHIPQEVRCAERGEWLVAVGHFHQLPQTTAITLIATRFQQLGPMLDGPAITRVQQASTHSLRQYQRAGIVSMIPVVHVRGQR